MPNVKLPLEPFTQLIVWYLDYVIQNKLHAIGISHNCQIYGQQM